MSFSTPSSSNNGQEREGTPKLCSSHSLREATRNPRRVQDANDKQNLDVPNSLPSPVTRLHTKLCMVARSCATGLKRLAALAGAALLVNIAISMMAEDAIVDPLRLHHMDSTQTSNPAYIDAWLDGYADGKRARLRLDELSADIHPAD